MSVGLIGNGGLGREIKSYLDRIGISSKFFLSDEFHNDSSDAQKISEFDIEKYSALVCIANPIDRENVINSLPKGIKYFTFIHPSAQIYTEQPIGEGSIICPNVVITSNVKIGNHVILNINTTVGHDTYVGNFCTVNPNTLIAGNCKIEDSVFIGSSSAIKEKSRIVKGTTVGMGAVVVNSIETKGTYVGIPAKQKH